MPEVPYNPIGAPPFKEDKNGKRTFLPIPKESKQDVTNLRNLFDAIGIRIKPDAIESDNFVASTVGWQLKRNGNITSASGVIAGWTIIAGYIYSLLSGTPTSSPVDGIVLSSTDAGVTIYEDGDKRVVLGFLSAGVYGLRVYATDGVTVIYETSDTQQIIAGWNFTSTVLRSGASDAASNVLIDSANSLIRLGPTSGDYVTLDGANLRLRSSTYVAGVSGFTVEPGLVEAQNLVARGIMRGSTFMYDVISAVGGQMMVANSDVLASDMTALDAATMTTRGNVTWAVDDVVVVRAVTALGIQEEWWRITNIGSAPTYTIARDFAAAHAADTNPIWKKGTTIVRQGSSDDAATFSGGWLRLLGEGSNSPYYSVFQRTGVAYNAYTEQVRMGNLNGFLDYAADVFGFAVGSTATGEPSIAIDPTNGLRIRRGTKDILSVDTSGNVTANFNGISVDALGEEDILYGESLTAGDSLCAISPSNFLFPEYGTGTATAGNETIVYGGTGSNTFIRTAMRFVATGTTVSGITLRLLKVGAPSDNIRVAVYSESGSSPNAVITNGTSDNIAGSSVNITWTDHSFTFSVDPTTVVGTAYWIVIERTGARDTSNYYKVCPFIENTATALPMLSQTDTGGSWTADYPLAINVTGQTKSFLVKTDANFAITSNFVAFAAENGSAGDTQKKVYPSGSVAGFSGLTPNVPVWLSDTAGAVASTPGTIEVQVGMARGSTTLIIDRETKKRTGTVVARAYSTEHTIGASGNTDTGGLTTTNDLVAQQFTAPGDITIDRIQVRSRFAISAPSGLVLEIRADDGSGDPDMTGGGLLASVGHAPSAGAQTTDNVSIGPIALASGVTYHVVWNATSATFGGGNSAAAGSNGSTVTVERIQFSNDSGSTWGNTGVNASWHLILQSSNGASINVGAGFYPKHVFVDDGADNYDLGNLFNESGVSNKNVIGFTLTRDSANTKTWLAIG